MDKSCKINRAMASLPDDSSAIVSLLQFLRAKEWQNVGELQVAKFPTTGRGIRTIRSRDFAAAETLIDMPFRSVFISLITLMDDRGFRSCCVDKLEGNVSTQLILTVYVLYQQHLGDRSKWKAYLDSLPKNLCTPHFCSQSELDCVPMVRNLVTKTLQGLYSSFASAFACALCECCGRKLVDLVANEELLLMYYLVNSRSVYCDPGIIRKSCSGGLSFLSDDPSMALAPFLDLFNHSDSVETESNLCLDSVSGELKYQLVTRTALGADSELFINYGNHDNFKLLMEYGFVIEGNRYEKIDLSLGQIENFMQRFPKYCHAKKIAFIRSREMHEEVFISAEGLSYNFETILRIFRSAGLTEKSLSEVVYQQVTAAIPIDESVDLHEALYTYLIARFQVAEGALNRIEHLTESGRMLREFFSSRIRFLSELVRARKEG